MKIILVSLDTVRADRLGCYGYPLPTTPCLDAIASKGVVFERAFAADIPTEVAHTDVFTGRVGLSTGVVAHGSPLSRMEKRVSWLPEILRRAGWTTAAVDNLYQLQEWFARGYRYYINSAGRTRWIDGRTVNDLAIPWIRAHREEDFFLFLHYWDPHTPYLPPREYVPLFYPPDRDPYDPANRSMDAAYNHRAYPFFKHHHYDLLGPVTDAVYMNALYDAELRYLDDRLRELDECLQSEGIHDDTLLILFGDHGESLTEHDIYWDHCGLYDATVRVPLMMRWPERIEGGRRVSGLVQQVDLMPTILEAAGIQEPAGLDGRSLWPCVSGTEDGTQPSIYLSECAWQASRGVRTEEWKFIRTLDAGPFVRPRRELYDLRADPDEAHNLAAEQPDVADALEAQLDAWAADTLQGRPDPMLTVLEQQGLPFRRRIEEILSSVGMSWNDWLTDPDRARFDTAYEARVRN